MFIGVDSEPGLGLLIGSDYLWRLLTGEVIRSPDIEGLAAINTIFGWTLQGPSRQKAFLDGGTHLMVCVLRVSSVTEDESASELLQAFWQLESMGIADSSEQSTDCLVQFKQTIQKNNGRYTVALPWKEGWKNSLTDNRDIALNRLQRLVKRLSHQEGLLQRYDTVIRQYLLLNHAEVVPKVVPDDRVVYYMPHREVVREESLTTKLRVVFDASSHSQGVPSLNDCLDKGTNLNPELLQVLLRFRWYPIAINSDIEKAFLQIEVQETDRDAFRFLWFENIPTSSTEKMVEWRMTRVPFGSTSSPFLLMATIHHHLDTVSEDDHDFARKLKKSFYVDDLLIGADTYNEGLDVYERSKSIMSKAAMNLRKWKTNNKQLQKVFDQKEENVDGASTSGTVLGMLWNTEHDCFDLSPKAVTQYLASVTSNSKRSLLKTAARIFDPLGVLAPFTVTAKILFQQLWMRQVSWDAELPTDVAMLWKAWCADLLQLVSIRIPRCVRHGLDTVVKAADIHVFVDASLKAYGACAYLKASDTNDHVVTSLIMAKSRVAPMKALTLPKLELMGAVVGTRMVKYLRTSWDTLSLSVVMWTDSTTVLNWIRGHLNKQNQFVRNRILEITTVTKPEDWIYCPGEDNPADLLTRGVSATTLRESRIWWRGPEWLPKPRSDWPTDPSRLKDACGEQMVPPQPGDKVSQFAGVLLQTQGNSEPILCLERFSSLQKLLRITAQVFRFMERCRRTQRSFPASITAEEMDRAEIFWIRHTQNEVFDREIGQLRCGHCVDKQSVLHNLHPFFDNNRVLRLSGRLQGMKAAYEEKHPVVLPKRHAFTRLMVVEAHCRVFHGGVASTMAQLRQRFWVIHARQEAKKVIRACFLCKRFSSRPVNVQHAPLPEDRLLASKPFEVTGLDFAGPLYVKNTPGATTSKTYVLLFTCSTTRAVHLELTTGLSSDAFLLAFRRFLARRGVPCTLYSDNALAFRRASRDIKEARRIMGTSPLSSFLATNRIKWKFIVPAAPWWGGWWERLIRSVKSALRKVLGKTSLSAEELTTLLTEVEAVINSRPLTYTYTSAEEPSPICPAHFLIGTSLLSIPGPGNEDDSYINQVTRETTISKLRYRQKLLDHLWNRWRREYILELRSFHHHPSASNRSLQVGDVVLVEATGTPRSLWLLGRVTEVFPGRDGLTRACSLKTQDGKIIKRPVQTLHFLEMGPPSSGGGRM